MLSIHLMSSTRPPQLFFFFKCSDNREKKKKKKKKESAVWATGKKHFYFIRIVKNRRMHLTSTIGRSVITPCPLALCVMKAKREQI